LRNNTPNFKFFSKSLFLARFISLLFDVFITEEVVDCNDDDDDDDDDGIDVIDATDVDDEVDEDDDIV